MKDFTDGNNSTTSTSKIRNKIVIRKNRSENGNRAETFLSNPHSKGDIFSRDPKVFFAKIIPIIITAIMIKKIRGT
jgi:hypothetical protein